MVEQEILNLKVVGSNPTAAVLETSTLTRKKDYESKIHRRS
jgi:hypothetical protein